jgi:hypothetical protein
MGLFKAGAHRGATREPCGFAIGDRARRAGGELWSEVTKRACACDDVVRTRLHEFTHFVL